MEHGDMQEVLRKDMNAFNTLTQVRLNTDLHFFIHNLCQLYLLYNYAFKIEMCAA